ncbi:hypothetical protein RRG08_021368 [Elysia crispata]|uniref:Uncharacterized protein n=1 Tax=Elysia crispata TaxID=231223 RepID=A0AAE0YBM3_9GAST|nr:hypothetical protein RRG08_021368 [Elysia crispata]
MKNISRSSLDVHVFPRAPAFVKPSSCCHQQGHPEVSGELRGGSEPAMKLLDNVIADLARPTSFIVKSRSFLKAKKHH